VALDRLKGPLTSIQQVITVLNKVIDAVNALLAPVFTAAPDSLAGYDNTGAFSNVTVGYGLSLSGGTLTTTNADDIHSGIYFITLGDTITVLTNKQIINKGGLDMEGDLLVGGQLFMER
jgi:hypothetical protein